MAERNTYDHIVKQKLSQLVVPDMESMWSDMHGILEREMPGEKKRGFLVWFFNRNNVLILLAFLILASSVTYYTITRTNEQSSLTNEKHIISNTPAGTVAQAEDAEKVPSTGGSNDHTTGNDRQAVRGIVAAEKKSSGSGNDKTTVTTQQQKVVDDRKEVPIVRGITNNRGAMTVVQAEPVDKKPVHHEAKGIDRQVVSGSNLVVQRRTPNIDQQRVRTVPQVVTASNTTTENEVVSTKSGEEIVEEETSMEEKIIFSGIKRIADAAALITNEDVASKRIAGTKVPVNERDLLIKLKPSSKKIFIAGLSVNYHLPVSGQEMSTITGTGRSNQVLDYLPSLYAQYHFADRWYVEAEFQYRSPQYVEPVRMESKFTPVNNNKKYEEWSTLSKLYYMNVPVSVHYKATKQINVGAGVQYSYLSSSIIETNICAWVKNNNNNWDKSYTSNKIHVKKNPKVEKRNTGNGNTPATLTQVDTLAQSLHGNDWRLMVDVNYKWRNITGGMKFTAGLNNYIQLNTGGFSTDVKDKNQAIQLYLRYDLFRSDRKKKR